MNLNEGEQIELGKSGSTPVKSDPWDSRGLWEAGEEEGRQRTCLGESSVNKDLAA